MHDSRPPVDLLRLIAKNLTEMVMAYDMDRKLVFVNPAVETLTGYSMEELQRDNFICWIHPEDQPRMLGIWDAVYQGKAFHDEEYRLVTRDGRVKWVVCTWRPLLDDDGAQVGVHGREFEITQRKLAETALRHSEERLRADEERYRGIFENSPFPLWEEDFSEIKRYLDGLAAAGVRDLRAHLERDRASLVECVRRMRILDVNRAAREFYGADSKEELMHALPELFDEQAFAVFRDEMVALYKNSTSFHTSFPVLTPRRGERLVEMIVSIVDGARHDWSRVIVSFFDITDHKKLEEQMAQAQRMESLGRLAGGVAHDFNNLLTVINGYSDWILGDLDAANPHRELLAEVRDAGERCAELTQQLLAFSRNQVARPAPLDLNRLILDCETPVRRTMGPHVEVDLRLAGSLPAIEADRSQLRQVLMNLAANARDSMPAGGTLAVETRAAGSHVVLEVRDTGHGLDEHAQRHLFEPFFRPKKGEPHTGLRLAIVFGVVSQGGGRIEVKSRPGEGTSFELRFPAVAGAAEAEPAATVVIAGWRGGGKVLVAEDRSDVREVTCRMLAELGYQPAPAADGQAALALASDHGSPVRLLVTDVLMPGMNGRELADRLREAHPGLRTVFMSGNTDEILADAGALNPTSVYLQKPFTLSQLADALRQIETA